MSSKNNPNARGEETKLRKYNNKDVKPVLVIDGSVRFMAAAYAANGQLVTDKAGKFIPYKNI